MMFGAIIFTEVVVCLSQVLAYSGVEVTLESPQSIGDVTAEYVGTFLAPAIQIMDHIFETMDQPDNLQDNDPRLRLLRDLKNLQAEFKISMDEDYVSWRQLTPDVLWTLQDLEEKSAMEQLSDVLQLVLENNEVQGGLRSKVEEVIEQLEKHDGTQLSRQMTRVKPLSFKDVKAMDVDFDFLDFIPGEDIY